MEWESGIVRKRMMFRIGKGFGGFFCCRGGRWEMGDKKGWVDEFRVFLELF